MNFIDRIKALADRAPQTSALLETEEATKNALIMPFLSALGYDVFNPAEVVPEFTADVGTKKGEKVDYAIVKDGEVIILVEAKKSSEGLSVANASQLFRYFTVTKARIAVLTNGLEYRFYSDIDEPNKMDAKPFLIVDLLNLNEGHLRELSRITKDGFDLETMLSTAGDLKHMREIRAVLGAQFTDPDEDFVRLFFMKANPGARFGKSAKEQFPALVRKAFSQFVADRVSERLHSALARNDDTPSSTETAIHSETTSEPATEPSIDGIVTTEEELQGFYIVKAIARSVLPGDRITFRDSKSYFAILADDNNRKPICRLHFNRSIKYIGLIDDEKNETRHALESIDDIYQYSNAIREAATRYVSPES